MVCRENGRRNRNGDDRFHGRHRSCRRGRFERRRRSGLDGWRQRERRRRSSSDRKFNGILLWRFNRRRLFDRRCRRDFGQRLRTHEPFLRGPPRLDDLMAFLANDLRFVNDPARLGHRNDAGALLAALGIELRPGPVAAKIERLLSMGAHVPGRRGAGGGGVWCGSLRIHRRGVVAGARRLRHHRFRHRRSDRGIWRGVLRARGRPHATPPSLAWIRRSYRSFHLASPLLPERLTLMAGARPGRSHPIDRGIRMLARYGSDFFIRFVDQTSRGLDVGRSPGRTV